MLYEQNHYQKNMFIQLARKDKPSVSKPMVQTDFTWPREKHTINELTLLSIWTTMQNILTVAKIPNLFSFWYK